MEIYYTDEFNVPEKINELNGFKGIKGILMEYSMTQQGLTMTMTAKELKAGKVKVDYLLFLMITNLKPLKN